MRIYPILLLVVTIATSVQAIEPDNSDTNIITTSVITPVNGQLKIRYVSCSPQEAQAKLFHGISCDSEADLRFAIQANVDLYATVNGRSPLMAAVEDHKYKALTFLLAQQVSVDEAVLKHAVDSHDIKAVLLLIQKGNAALSFCDFSRLICNSKNVHIVFKSAQTLTKRGCTYIACKLLHASASITQYAKAHFVDNQ